MRSNCPATHPRLVEVLFGVYRRQILGLLLLRPDETFYVREIARLTGVPVGSLHRELKLLTAAGLLIRSRLGNQVRYQADLNCTVYKELAGIFRKSAGLADVLRDALAPFSTKISLAFIFGSVAQGKEGAFSDIDMLVIGTVPFVEIVDACTSCRERLGREINPVVMSSSIWKTKYKQGDRFVSRVAEEPKLFLIGDSDEFGKLTQNRAA
jgi:DNA-binding transcriptional ArsR family regulator